MKNLPIRKQSTDSEIQSGIQLGKMSGEITSTTTAEAAASDHELHEPGGPETAPKAPPRRSSLSARHLAALAAAVVLSASGMISAHHFATVIFSVLYMHFISKVAFPRTSPRPDPPVFNPKSKILGNYVLFTFVIGVLLPVAYIIDGVISADEAGTVAAASHLFLLVSQIFMEGVAYSGGHSLPVFVFVPVFYNSMRIWSLLGWIGVEIGKEESGLRLYAGRGLAFANMALWSFNLFGFLLPVFLPKAFQIYYSRT